MKNNQKKILTAHLLLGLALLSSTIVPTMFKLPLMPLGKRLNPFADYQKELAQKAQETANYIDRREKFMPVIRHALTLLTQHIPEDDTKVMTLLTDIARDQKDSFTPKEKNNLLWIIEKLGSRHTEIRDRNEAIRLLSYF